MTLSAVRFAASVMHGAESKAIQTPSVAMGSGGRIRRTGSCLFASKR